MSIFFIFFPLQKKQSWTRKLNKIPITTAVATTTDAPSTTVVDTTTVDAISTEDVVSTTEDATTTTEEDALESRSQDEQNWTSSW